MVSVHRHVAVLQDSYEPGEREVKWIRAQRVDRGHQGALMVSDRNVYWIGLGAFTQSQETVPLLDVTGSTVVHGAKTSTLTLEMWGIARVFSGKSADVAALDAALRTVWTPPEPQEQLSLVLVDELERLVRLRDAEAITLAEFEAAKRQLLR